MKDVLINNAWFEKNDACRDGVLWVKENVFKKRGITEIPALELIHILQAKRLDWAIWVLCHIMDYKGYVSIAIYAAELVLPDFEKKYPDNTAPREAIEAAKKCIENPSEENKNAFAAIAYSSYSATAATAYSTTAASAVYAAYAASATSAKKETNKKILDYGLELINV